MIRAGWPGLCLPMVTAANLGDVEGLVTYKHDGDAMRAQNHPGPRPAGCARRVFFFFFFLLVLPSHTLSTEICRVGLSCSLVLPSLGVGRGAEKHRGSMSNGDKVPACRCHEASVALDGSAAE